MPSNGIMKEIRSHLDQELSNAEVIALGFKPSTVYKARRLMRPTKVASTREELAQTPNRDVELEAENHEDCLDHTGPCEEIEYWRKQFNAEQKALAEAEARAARLKEENQLLRQKLESLPNHLAQEVWKLVEPLEAELRVLRSAQPEINPTPGSPSRRWPTRVIQERRNW